MPIYPSEREALLARLSEALAPAGPDAYLSELMAGGPSHHEQALNKLFAFCESDPALRGALVTHAAGRQDLQEAYELLLNAGAGQWAGRHYVPVAALGHAPTLDFVLQGRGKRDWQTTAILLIEYFERDETGRVPDGLRGPVDPIDPAAQDSRNVLASDSGVAAKREGPELWNQWIEEQEDQDRQRDAVYRRNRPAPTSASGRKWREAELVAGQPRERAVIERVIVEEFGLTAVDDPVAARTLLETKLRELDPFERAALERRIGVELQNAEQGRPHPLFLVVPYALMCVVGWLIWRPLAAVAAILAAGLMYRPVTARLYYWRLTTVTAVGITYGFGLAAFVRLFSLLAQTGAVGTWTIGVVGLLCAGHLGYTMAPQVPIDPDIDRKHKIVQCAALASYVGALVALIMLVR
jgi:hypothetical protein